MKLNFQYDKEKDIWCLLSRGKSSDNADSTTKVYETLTAHYGNNPTHEDTSRFIDAYILEKNISIEHYLERYQKEWNEISEEFQKRAERIFNVVLPDNITAYFTINNRCPYNIEENYFFVTTTTSVRALIMHELWHFYTWYGLGADELQKRGAQKYNDLKESLTVLLNIECQDLLPEGMQDIGYPQHQETREKILRYWDKDKNIKNLWNYLSQ